MDHAAPAELVAMQRDTRARGLGHEAQRAATGQDGSMPAPSMGAEQHLEARRVRMM